MNNKPTYKDSNGKRYTRAIIENRIVKAKQRKDEMMFDTHSYYFCERCKINSNNARIQKSHVVSIKWALENGMSEISWDVDDLENLCEKCHRLFEDTFSNSERLLYYRLRKQGLTFSEFAQYIESGLDIDIESGLDIDFESGTGAYKTIFLKSDDYY